jgi:hypothetical protein
MNGKDEGDRLMALANPRLNQKFLSDLVLAIRKLAKQF